MGTLQEVDYLYKIVKVQYGERDIRSSIVWRKDEINDFIEYYKPHAWNTCKNMYFVYDTLEYAKQAFVEFYYKLPYYELWECKYKRPKVTITKGTYTSNIEAFWKYYTINGVFPTSVKEWGHGLITMPRGTVLVKHLYLDKCLEKTIDKIWR